MACYQCFSENLGSEYLCAVFDDKFFGLDAGCGRYHLNCSGEGHCGAGHNVFHRADVFHGLWYIDGFDGVVRATVISVESDYFQAFGQGYLQVRTFVFGILGKPHKSEYGILRAVDSDFLGHCDFAGIFHVFIVVRDYDSSGVLVYGGIVAVSDGLIERIPEIAHRVCRQPEVRRSSIRYTVFDSANSFELTPCRVGLVSLYRSPRHIKCGSVAHRGVVVVDMGIIGIIIGIQWVIGPLFEAEGILVRFGRILVFAGNGHNIIRTVTETIAKFRRRIFIGGLLDNEMFQVAGAQRPWFEFYRSGHGQDSIVTFK